MDNPSAESIDGNTLGNMVSTYFLLFEDGTQIEVPVYRRFAIQQRHVCWGSESFRPFQTVNRSTGPAPESASMPVSVTK